MNTRRNVLLAIALIISLVASVGVAVAAEGVHWTYEGAEGPDHWGDLSPDFAKCSTGTEQSPIDIVGAPTTNPADIKFNYQPVPLTIVNNGHTIQVNYAAGSSIEVSGKTYKLLQFHFHAPSEHTIAGKAADMELHLVHQAADGQLAVVGVLLMRGAENAAYNPVLNNLPAQAGDPATVSGVTVNASDLLPATATYYRYNGSLTTPPCSEGVQWLLMNTPVELSDAQIAAYTKIYEGNARPVQAFNARTFLVSSALTPVTLPTTGSESTPGAAGLLAVGTLAVAGGLYIRRRKVA